MYVLSGAAAAAAAGAAAGALGSLVTLDVRVALATAAALVAAVVGAIELRRGAFSPLQCDRETPRSWMHRGPLRWAARNGASLGVGAGTRIGFVLWYAIPAAAFLSGSVVLGAAVWGAYGATRTASAYPLLRAAVKTGDFDALSLRLLERRPLAARACAGMLLVLAAGTLVTVGL